MLFRMDTLLYSLSDGLDAIEKELFGVTTNHGKRIAVLVINMGQRLGWTKDELIGVGACALLHDNALTEFILAEKLGALHSPHMKKHCIKGEENASHLPFPASTKGFILYHHEYADGSGTFGVNAAETPVGAQFIAAADWLDTNTDLRVQDEKSTTTLIADIQSKRGTFFMVTAADALTSILNHELLSRLRDENVADAFDALMPQWEVDLSPAVMMNIAKTVAQIIDYKSEFTAKHSIQIANRAYFMARYYGMDDETCAKIYFAASLHDIGKLLTPVDILEKRGALTPEEFSIIKNHVHWSYIMLKDVGGFDEICRWAVSHHRKLNDKGYPDLPANFFPLDFISRLLACIDIYQAVRETRPYHAGRTHRETMDIMWLMAGRGEIDKGIVQDLDAQMARFKENDGDVPSPAQIDAFGFDGRTQ